MQTKNSAVSWGFPVIVWIASLATIGAGFVGDSSLIGIGVVMLATAVIMTLMAMGIPTSKM